MALKTQGRDKKMKTKTLKQVVQFKASPREIFEMLVDAKKHSRFTGSAVKISRKVGDAFSAYDGYIEGRNLEIVPGKKIVQSWRGSDFPEGHYSVACFELKPKNGGTELTFTQNDVPAALFADIQKGWKDYYWEPMKQFLAGIFQV